MYGAATFSPDGKKRFELIRDWWSGDDDVYGTVLLVMLNPSTADAVKDDPTIRKAIGFAKRWGYTRLVVVNLLPNVETHPAKLPPVVAIDEENFEFISKWFAHVDTGIIVVGWGAMSFAMRRRLSKQKTRIRRMAREMGIQLWCIGTTKNGSPKHPSRAGYTTRPLPFP